MFYENFEKTCRKNGISPTATLKKLKISTSKLTAWKNGSMPNSEFLIPISEFLDVSIDYLLTGKEKSIQEPIELSENEQELTDIEEKLLKDFRSLSQQGQDYIRQQMFIAREVYKNDNLPQSNLNAG